MAGGGASAGQSCHPLAVTAVLSGTSFAVIDVFPPDAISKSFEKNSNPSFWTFNRCLPGSTEIVIGPFSPFRLISTLPASFSTSTSASGSFTWSRPAYPP